jgi:hypothetical protein
MPTKRKKLSRKPESRITGRAVELYGRGLALEDFRNKCSTSDEMCTHPECDEHREIDAELGRLLGLFPHQPSPLGSYAGIQTWPENGGPVAEIKHVLDAALQAKIAPAAGEDRTDE